MAYRAAWRVIVRDPALWWAPLLVVLAGVVSAVMGVWAIQAAVNWLDRWNLAPIAFLALFPLLIFLLATALVVAEAIIVATAHERLTGGSPTILRSLWRVVARIPALLAWAYWRCVVGFTYRGGGRERLALRAGGVAVEGGFVFVIPILVVDGGSVFSAVRQSSQLVSACRDDIEGRTESFGRAGLRPFLLLFLAGPLVVGALVLGLDQLLPHPPAGLWKLIFLPLGAGALFLVGNAIASGVYRTALFDSARGVHVEWFPPEALLANVGPATLLAPPSAVSPRGGSRGPDRDLH